MAPLINKLLLSSLLLLFGCTAMMAQFYDYERQAKLLGVSEEYHELVLPSTVYQYCEPRLSDLRVFELRTSGDTIQAPYILTEVKNAAATPTRNFEQINTVQQEGTHFVTLKLTPLETINQIDLKLSNRNFDWRVRLEGSNDQNEWFMLLDDYRILNIENNATRYSFTQLNFEKAEYQYYRIGISSDEQPQYTSFSLKNEEGTSLPKHDYEVVKIQSSLIRNGRSTQVDLALAYPGRIDQLLPQVDFKQDYFRKVELSYLVDSVETEKGWFHNYRSLTTSHLSSLEANILSFPPVVAQHFRLVIVNGDNPPLPISGIQAKGNQHLLKIRMDPKSEHYLAYSNPKAAAPKYDLIQFQNSIPDELETLTLGEEKYFPKTEKEEKPSLFENQRWLWIIMGVIVLLLIYLSIKMLGSKAD